MSLRHRKAPGRPLGVQAARLKLPKSRLFNAVLCGDAATVSKCLLMPLFKTMAMPAIHLHGENPWKLGLGFVVLALFFGLGLAHVFRPGYFYRRSGIRKGGEMLTEFNLIGVQMVQP